MLRSIVNVGGQEFVQDNQTGEILFQVPDDAQLVLVPKIKARNKPFVIAYQQALFDLAEKKLKPTCWRMLIVYIALCDFENKVPCGLVRVATILGISKQHAFSCRRELVKHGLLILKINEDMKVDYFLSAHVSWKGKLASQKKWIENEIDAIEFETSNRKSHTYHNSCTCGSSLLTNNPAEHDDWIEAHSGCSDFGVFEVEEPITTRDIEFDTNID